MSSNRRDFLTGRAARAAAEAAGQALADRLSEAESRRAPPGGDAVRLTTRAMACDFSIFLPMRDRPHPAHVARASDALDMLHSLEDQMTVYRAHGELSEINRRAAHEDVEVEPRLFELLLEARDVALATEGAFDPTSGPLVALWRQCRNEARIPTQAEIDAARELTGIEHVRFDERRRTIRYDREGVEFNLGGIGKGHALDRCGEFLLRADVADWLFHGGHSSILARGSQRPHVGWIADPSGESERRPADDSSVQDDAGDSADRGRIGNPSCNEPAGWPIAIRHPLFPSERYATIVLRNRAMSTSGSGVQHFRHAGKRYGHILDPRTGWPVEGVLSVTVLAETAARADALSTAFFVMGLEKARAYCDTDRSVAALLIPPPRRGRTLEPVRCNLPDDVLYFEGCTSRIDARPEFEW
ncbi:MAG: FAD:protein FMN transferase [Planctomycetaceae bacterium]